MMKADDRKEIFLKMLRKNLGMITQSCKDANISRSQFYVWRRDDVAFNDEVKVIEMEQIDFVEGELIKKIKSGSEKSIHFYLKHKGGENGYKTNLDITTGGEKINQKVQIEIVKGVDGA